MSAFCARGSTTADFSGKWIRRKKLADRVADLAHVTFQAKWALIWRRPGASKMVKELGGDGAALRAAHLLKADLTTELVKEFTNCRASSAGSTRACRGSRKKSGSAFTTH